MISYELALGLSVIPVFLIYGTLNLTEVTNWQRINGWLLAPVWTDGFNLERFLLWIPVAISAFIFMISLFAETNRLPFDLPESETELVAGYHTEYSSMKFALFFLGEYCAMIAGAAVFVTIFLGGWTLPGVPDGSSTWFFGLTFPEMWSWVPGVFWGLVNITTFFAKVALILFLFIWVRWTLPRFRYDQLMRLGWVVFFELALVNIFVAAGLVAWFAK
jgi:NADH-quinone oxidoreductase subunit H